MAPVKTTDAATVDQRCHFKHRTGWRHNHSNSKLCVALRMGQANLLSITNCHLCAGAMLSSSNDSIYSSHPWIEATRSIFQATRFVRVILVQAIPLYRSKKKLPISDLVMPAGDPTAFLTRHPCSGDHANLLWIIQQKKPSNYAFHPCAGVMLIFSERELSVSSLRRGHAISVVQKQKKRLHFSNCICQPCAGTTQIFCQQKIKT